MEYRARAAVGVGMEEDPTPHVEYVDMNVETVGTVEAQNMSNHYDFNMDCAFAAVFGQPCASSVHDSANATDARTYIEVDTEPLGKGIESAGSAVALGMVALAFAHAFRTWVNR